MTADSKPSKDVRDVRGVAGEREAVPRGGNAGEGSLARTGRGRTGGAETFLRDKYAELRASGLACDRW